MNRETARRELLRLLEGLEFYRSWQITSLEREKGEVTKDDLNQIVMPSSDFLEIFDATKGKRCYDVIKEVQQWYSNAASDLFRHAKIGGEAWIVEVNKFLTDFQNAVGFSFLSEAGFLRKAIDKSLKLQGIANQDDYYSLKELENDLSQTIASDKEMASISDFLREFENKSSKH